MRLRRSDWRAPSRLLQMKRFSGALQGSFSVVIFGAGPTAVDMAGSSLAGGMPPLDGKVRGIRQIPLDRSRGTTLGFVSVGTSERYRRRRSKRSGRFSFPSTNQPADRSSWPLRKRAIHLCRWRVQERESSSTDMNGVRMHAINASELTEGIARFAV